MLEWSYSDLKVTINNAVLGGEGKTARLSVELGMDGIFHLRGTTHTNGEVSALPVDERDMRTVVWKVDFLKNEYVILDKEAVMNLLNDIWPALRKVREGHSIKWNERSYSGELSELAGHKYLEILRTMEEAVKAKTLTKDPLGLHLIEATKWWKEVKQYQNPDFLELESKQLFVEPITKSFDFINKKIETVAAEDGIYPTETDTLVAEIIEQLTEVYGANWSNLILKDQNKEEGLDPSSYFKIR